jgi:malonyl-CoA O-methyltransferase
MINNLRLRNNFSKVANSYEVYASIQVEVANRLLANLNGVYPERILDIGMGTGRFTEEIKLRFPKADIYGIDFSEGMVRESRKKDFLLTAAGDAQLLPFKNNSFNLIVSNLCYQWVGDLGLSFSEVRRILKDEGVFLFSFFATDTLKELRESISHVMHNSGSPQTVFKNNLLSLEEPVNFIKQAGLRIKLNNFYSKKVLFQDLFELLYWLKRIGANRFGDVPFIGKNSLDKMNYFYQKNFSDNGKIFATFEVAEIRAIK